MDLNLKMLKSSVTWILGGSFLVASGLYAAYVYSTIRSSPLHLVSCMEVNAPWSAWTCEQILRHSSFSKTHVIELNRSAGARFPISINDAEKAEEILALFLARGVDINAPDDGLKSWTALHGAAISDRPKDVALLLKYGAKVDVRDMDGRTPLDLARLVQQKRPDDPAIAETIRLLEEARNNSRS